MSQPPLDDEKELLRSRRTLFLLLGGAASLLLPLMGVLYLKLTDPTAAKSLPPAAVVFDKRGFDGQSSQKILPAATPAGSGGLPMAPGDKPAVSPAVPPGSSLSFVRGGDDMYEEPQAAAPAPAPAAPAPQPPRQAPAPPPPPAEPPPEAQAAAQSFQMPRLKRTGNFKQFGNSNWRNPPTKPSNAPPIDGAAAAAMAAAQQKEQERRYGKSASGPGSGANLPKLGGLGQRQAQQNQAVDPNVLPIGANGQPDLSGILNRLPQPPSDPK